MSAKSEVHQESASGGAVVKHCDCGNVGCLSKQDSYVTRLGGVMALQGGSVPVGAEAVWADSTDDQRSGLWANEAQRTSTAAEQAVHGKRLGKARGQPPRTLESPSSKASDTFVFTGCGRGPG